MVLIETLLQTLAMMGTFGAVCLHFAKPDEHKLRAIIWNGVAICLWSTLVLCHH